MKIKAWAVCCKDGKIHHTFEESWWISASEEQANRWLAWLDLSVTVGVCAPHRVVLLTGEVEG